MHPVLAVAKPKRRHLALFAVLAVAAPVVLIGTAVLVVAAAIASDQHAAANTCDTAVSDPGGPGQTGLDPEQRDTALKILAVAKELGVPARGWVIAIGVARQESGIRPLDHGDASSLGPFQQLAEWGPRENRINPTTSARMFFLGGQAGQRGLLAVPGWEQMTFAEAAQSVQHAAFPGEWAKQEAPATAIVAELTGQVPNAPCSSSTGPVYILGDSITVGAEPDLRALLAGRQVTVNAAVGRTLLEGIQELSRDQAQLAGVALVVGLCTNYGGDEATFAGLIDQTMAVAVGVSSVVWVTCTEWSPAQPLANAAIRAARSRYASVRVAEWAAPSLTPGMLGSDGVHPTAAGRAEYARIVVAALPSGAPIVGGYALPLPREFLVPPLPEHHDGSPAVDMPAPIGTPIFAVTGGTVVYTRDGDGCGLGMEIVDQNGARWMYCHASVRQVANGDTVTTGQQVALVGSTGDSTGPHLHIQITTADGQRRCPQPFLNGLVDGQTIDLAGLRTSGPCT